MAFARPLGRYQIRTNFMSEFHVYSHQMTSVTWNTGCSFVHCTKRNSPTLSLLKVSIQGQFQNPYLSEPWTFSLFIYSPRTLLQAVKTAVQFHSCYF